MSAQIKQTLPALNSAMSALNKSGVQANMNNFEKVMEDLDVQTEGMNGVMDGVMGETSADSDAVTQLLQQLSGGIVVDQQQQMGMVG